MTAVFTDRMVEYAKSQLGMAVSTPLIEGWQQLETACNAGGRGRSVWQVLQLPTGTGKTQALAVLCAIQPIETHPGILIVTRYTEEADALAATINKIAGKVVAVAAHQKSQTNQMQIRESPVLIVTHAAYRNALREVADAGEHTTQWDRIRHYHHGERSWVIIDEAFDWVETFQCELQQLSALNGALASIAGADQYSTVRDLQELTQLLVRGFQVSSSAKLLNSRQTELVHGLDIDTLLELVTRSAASDLDFCPSIEKPIGSLRAEYRAIFGTLRSLQSVPHVWACRTGKRIKLNGARLLMGMTEKPGVLLDATAGIDPFYELLSDRVELLPRPHGSRNYGNVTLNLSSGHKVGKEHLTATAAHVWPTVRSTLELAVDHNARTLIVCHKDVEEAIGPRLSTGGSTSAHWGNIDGRNHWNEYNVGVYFGLPYLDDITPTNIALASQPHLALSWFNGSRAFGNHKDIGQALKDGFVARSVVQALNRLRCRRSIDQDGNCLPTELYLLQPKGRTAAVLKEAIQSQMPGIRLRDWDMGLVTNRSKTPPTHSKLLAFLQAAAPGIYTKSNVVASLGINTRTFERLSSILQQAASPLSRALSSSGVQYFCDMGRGKEAYFMKS